MGRHLAFVVASYAVTTLVLAGLIVWAILDHRAQGAAPERPRIPRRRPETAPWLRPSRPGVRA